MDILKRNVSRKYAIAFLNLFIDKIDENQFVNINSCAEFLLSKKDVLSFLTLPYTELEVKNLMISKLLSKFNLISDFKTLTDLLLKQNRISLLPDVLRQIFSLYQIRKNLIYFDISSALPLTGDQALCIKEFLQKNSKNNIIAHYNIDKNLIAGIRAQSYNYLWDHSVAGKIKDLNKLFNNFRNR